MPAFSSYNWSIVESGVKHYNHALLLFYFVDDDGDGLIDEDLANPPRGTNIYKYISYSH
jgi:hypothetical protein